MHVYAYTCVCTRVHNVGGLCLVYIGVVVPAENGVRRPPIGLPLAGPGVARCSHRFRQSLADSAPAAILNDSGINTRGAEKKVHAGPLPPSPSPPGSLGRISRPFYLRSHATPPLTLALYLSAGSCNHRHRCTTLLFPLRGTLTPFRRRLPPPVPSPSPRRARRYRSSSDGIPGGTTPTIDDPAEGGDRGRSCIRARRKVRAYTYSVFARSKIIEKMLGESGVAGIPPWRRRPRPSLPRSTVISSPPPSPPPLHRSRREYTRFPRAFSFSRTRCYVARYVFNTGQLVGK